jgi:hypothetical protein
MVDYNGLLALLRHVVSGNKTNEKIYKLWRIKQKYNTATMLHYKQSVSGCLHWFDVFTFQEAVIKNMLLGINIERRYDVWNLVTRYDRLHKATDTK